MTQPSSTMHREFHYASSKLVLAIDKRGKVLGRPGGFGRCGRCDELTQWGWCPRCQPTRFGEVP